MSSEKKTSQHVIVTIEVTTIIGQPNEDIGQPHAKAKRLPIYKSSQKEKDFYYTSILFAAMVLQLREQRQKKLGIKEGKTPHSDDRILRKLAIWFKPYFKEFVYQQIYILFKQFLKFWKRKQKRKTLPKFLTTCDLQTLKEIFLGTMIYIFIFFREDFISNNKEDLPNPFMFFKAGLEKHAFYLFLSFILYSQIKKYWESVYIYKKINQWNLMEIKKKILSFKKSKK